MSSSTKHISLSIGSLCQSRAQERWEAWVAYRNRCTHSRQATSTPTAKSLSCHLRENSQVFKFQPSKRMCKYMGGFSLFLSLLSLVSPSVSHSFTSFLSHTYFLSLVGIQFLTHMHTLLPTYTHTYAHTHSKQEKLIFVT